MTTDTPLGAQDKDQGRTILRKVAYDSFMQTLAVGTIKPGQMVSQRELCELLSVPMGPMREALKRLEAEHIVRLIPQRGIEIIDIDELVVDEVYQMRRMVELEAIDVFARDVPEERVRDLLRRTERAAEIELDVPPTLEENRLLTQMDHEMHVMFVASLRNRFAEEVHRRVLAQLHLVRFFNKLRRMSGRNALTEHVEVLEALLDGRPEQARDRLDMHLEASRRRAKGLE